MLEQPGDDGNAPVHAGMLQLAVTGAGLRSVLTSIAVIAQVASGEAPIE